MPRYIDGRSRDVPSDGCARARDRLSRRRELAEASLYANHRVDEVLIVDPDERSVQWPALTADEYRDVDGSGLIALTASELAHQLDWP
jgi:hypothetical protein